jgi:hypothetical protein
VVSFSAGLKSAAFRLAGYIVNIGRFRQCLTKNKSFLVFLSKERGNAAQLLAFRLGGAAVFLLDGKIDFFSVYLYVLRGIDAKLDLVTINRDDCDFYVVIQHDGFFCFAGEDEHLFPLLGYKQMLSCVGSSIQDNLLALSFFLIDDDWRLEVGGCFFKRLLDG